MFIGRWNKSVVLTYIGIIFAILGMKFAFEEKLSYSISCLIVSGICDLFDGKVARSIKRTKEEELFGIELDSMADVINFIALPISIFISYNSYNYIYFAIYIFFAICGVARLSHFNSSAKKERQDYFQGLPVTYTALIIPIVYLLKGFLAIDIFNIIFSTTPIIIGILNILNIKIPKPKGKAYIFFSILAIVVLFLYLFKI